MALYPQREAPRRGRAALRDRRRARRDARGAASRAGSGSWSPPRARRRSAPRAGGAGAATLALRHRARRTRTGLTRAWSPRLEAMGYRRVAHGDRRGASSASAAASWTCTASGWRRRPGCEFWGDELVSLRGFDLDTQRSLGAARRGHGAAGPVRSAGRARRRRAAPTPQPCSSCCRPAPCSSRRRRAPMRRRSPAPGREAEHHLEIARRLGEDVPPRDELFESPERWRARGRLRAPAAPRRAGRTSRLGFLPPEPSTATCSGCARSRRRAADADPLRQRRPARAARGAARRGAGRGSHAHARARRARRRLRDAGAPGPHRPRDLPPGAAPPRGRAATGRRRRPPATGDSQPRRLRRAPRPRHRDLPRHPDHRGGRGHPRRRRRRVRGRRPAQRAALPPRPARALPGRRRGRRPPAAQAPPARRHGLEAGSGTRPARPSSQMAAELLDLYARRQVCAGYAFPPDTRWQRELESSFLYEDTPDQRNATEEVKRDMERPRPDGPAAGRRRRLREDRGRGARGVQGGAGREAGGGAGADDDSRGAARPDLRRAAGGLPGADRRAVALPDAPRSRRRRSRELAAGKVDIVIGTHRLLSPDVVFKDLGPAGGGRGAPLRRGAQGAAQEAAADRGRADPDGDADPAHPAAHPGRAPRPDADRDAAARPLAGADLRGAVGRRAARGGDGAGAGPRRAGLRRPQPDRDDRDHGGADPALAPRARVAIGHGEMAAATLER